MIDTTTNHSPRVTLVLQGGGALGAYQAGVYQALEQFGYVPDWIAGTSIGAINGALISGNPPDRRLERLREFWQRVSGTMPYHAWFGPVPPHGDALLSIGSMASAINTLVFGQGGFFRPRLDFALSSRPEELSFYDTSPLRRTLAELVDFNVLNSSDVRLTIGAVNVTRGELEYFDTGEGMLDVRHILASGALPPGLPPVRIDGALYWDGGIYSNTPLEVVLDRLPRYDSLCFMVNLWDQVGHEPTSMADIVSREKEIRYASRFHREIEAFRERHTLRHAVRTLYESLSEAERERFDLKTLASLGCHTRMDIVRLGPAVRSWECALKDADFESLTLRQRWDQGYREASAVLEQAPWRSTPRRDAPDEMVRLFEPPHAKDDSERSGQVGAATGGLPTMHSRS